MKKTSTKPAAGKKKVKKKSKAALIAGKFGRIFVTVMQICVITGCIVVGAVALYVMNFVKPYNINLTDAQLKFTTQIYANDPGTGNPNVIQEVSGSENRIWVDIQNVPKNLTNAIISTEDQRFNEHEGVDVKRTLGAFANYFFHFYSSNQGGSTITQQVVKNLEGNVYNRTPSIKIREIITALNVEQKFSKDQILQTYVNTIPLGNGCYGMQTAANMYFGKDVKDLDLAQCALLAGIIKSPSGDEPYNHLQNALTRQKYVLQNMLSQKMITKAEYTAAVNEKITIVPKKTTVRSWFVDQVITDVTNDLMSQKGCSKETAQNMIFSQGLKIYTTENPTIQADMDTVFTSDQYKSLFYHPSNKDYFNGSMIIADYSGRILGIEGSQGAKTTNMPLNYATQTTRQPGSSFKPICSYGPAIDQDLIDWSSMYFDGPVKVLNGKDWPKDDEAWSMANRTIDEALTQSLNTIAVRVEQLVGSRSSYNFLTNKLGFTTLTSKPDKNGDDDADSLGITLGMLQNGVTVREMVGAYEIFGNGGVFNKPYTYTKVEDADGNIILQNKPAAIQAISPETATIMNELMQNVVESGTGTAAQLSNCPVAGKTGTTSDNKDRWWMGDTPEYVGGVWTGYDMPKDMGGLSTNPAVLVWHAVMQLVEKNRNQANNFPMSGNVVQESYDLGTGNVVAPGASNSAAGWYKTTDKKVTGLQNSGQSGTTPDNTAQ